MIFLDPQQSVDLMGTILKEIEERVFQSDKAVVLPNLPRCLQLDAWTCGARSVYSILRYFGKRCDVMSVERDLRTDREGTDVVDIKRVFSMHGLRHRVRDHCRVSDLVLAIDNGSPILISTHRSWHYSVVYGYSERHIFVMNPAIIGECGRLWCSVPRMQFLTEWDRWAIVVREG